MQDRELIARSFLSRQDILPEIRIVGEKVLNKERLTEEDGVLLFEKASLPLVGMLANLVRERLHGDTTYFNRNFHIEPTNVCVFSCKFVPTPACMLKRRRLGTEYRTDDAYSAQL